MPQTQPLPAIEPAKKDCYLRFQANVYTDGRGKWYVMQDGAYKEMPRPDLSTLVANGWVEVLKE